MSVAGILVLQLERSFANSGGRGFSFPPFPCSHYLPSLSNLPQKPPPLLLTVLTQASPSAPAQGWQGLGSFFSLPAGLLSPCRTRNKVTWCSGYVHPRKGHRSLKPKIFSYSAREGYSFHLNRGMKLFFRPELAILRKTKELYISMG